MIEQQERNVSADNQVIDAMQKQQTTIIPEPTKREQAENGSVQRPTDPPQSQQTQSGQTQTEPSSRILRFKGKISELSTLVIAFSQRENKSERVAIYPNVNCFTDSSRAKPARSQTISQKRSRKRKANKNQYQNKLEHNEKFIKNMSNKDLTDQETALLAKDLKFIPTPPPASHKSILRDYNTFTRSMR